ncbi:putative golgi transport complex subunit 5 [Lyophyllum shimeji]|uniref:Conserved oligomeric Golgi complex subunit 5 n=1 Tax=Lyophyllum shimeji TaxID=47721 RepID=A0A9P3PKR8_LYOSH|nr:putative golgi transport complex subunit 5 [Lyophyllum shimeji]
MSDFAVFASSNFDANEYANAILAGEPYPPVSDAKSPPKLAVSPQDLPAKEDISVAISKLTFSIDDVSKQIKNVVATHHEALLSQAASANDLAGSLTPVRSGLNDLDSSLEKLRQKIRVPYQSLQSNVSRLQRLQQASDVLRRTSRFVVLARRLQIQMADMDNSSSADVKRASAKTETSHADGLLTHGHDLEDEKERVIAKAALSIAELVALLDGPNAGKHAIVLDRHGDRKTGPKTGAAEDGIVDTQQTVPLRSINAVAAHVPFVEEARMKVTNEMENMVLTGLTTLNQSLLASSLQTAYNLRVLPELVHNLILDLSQAVEERIRNAFDLSKISKEALAKDSAAASSPQSPPTYRSRVRTEPTNVTAPQFAAALWSRLEVMIEDMADCCIKVYTLEKVLKLKKDAVTQMPFLDEALKLLENKPSATFWTSLGRSLEKHARDSAKSSTFLQQTLSTGYPKLLRLFHEFFAKIAVHTDTVYSPTYQSPETVFVLRALSNFEALYLARSSNKLNEAVAQAFAGGIRAPPGASEGINVARTVANELDSARFDPLLVKAVAKNAASSLEMMLSRVDGMVVRDRSAVTLMGPTATLQQGSNAQLATCLYQCWLRLDKLRDDHTETVFDALKPNILNMSQAYEHLVEPLMTAIRRELSAIIVKLHRMDFGKAVDPMSGMGGSSFYMKDLVEKLSFIKTEVLTKFNIGEAGRTWVTSIVKFVMRTFVLHVSIARPLGEGGKLRLTSDMAELEFALSAFMVENPQSKRGGDLETIGDEYRALRAMRPLLFLDNAMLAMPERTAGLPPLVVLHHILVRSPMPLPHALHGWQEAEYVRWVDEHSEREAWSLIEGGLSHWEKVSESEGKDSTLAAEYIELARTVLQNAQGS